MIDAEYARTLSDCDRWMNERLLALCRGLSDEERRRDRGAFFRSVYGTPDRQLTTLRSQMGIDPGVTDLPFMPGLAR